MREILFRGQTCGGEWVEGSLHIEYGETTKDGKRNTDYRILGMRGECSYILHETIGQYTGLTDKNGKKIFEGDIFKPYEDEIIYVAWIECFSTLGLMVHTTIEKKKYGKVVSKFVQEGFNFLCDYKLDELEVIGNIHDNPELLKEGTDND